MCGCPLHPSFYWKLYIYMPVNTDAILLTVIDMCIVWYLFLVKYHIINIHIACVHTESVSELTVSAYAWPLARSVYHVTCLEECSEHLILSAVSTIDRNVLNIQSNSQQCWIVCSLFWWFTYNIPTWRVTCSTTTCMHIPSHWKSCSGSFRKLSHDSQHGTERWTLH